MNLSIFAIAIWVVTLGIAAISDLKSFRIPNILPAIIIVLFVLVHAMFGFSWRLQPNLLHFLLALGIGMSLFSVGWIGGGDAKLYAAVALWFDWNGAVTLIFMTTMSGLFLAIAFVVARMAGIGRPPKNGNKPKSKMERRIPYGVAIALGAVFSAAWGGWGNVFPAI